MSEPRWSLHFAWGRAPYALDLPEVVIGRGDHCTLQIEEPNAADEHARFIVGEDESVWLESVHDDRPTLHNGRPIAGRTRLHDGDFVQIGHSVLTLRSTARRAAQAPSEARTIAGEMPEEVRRLLAQRDPKNFVVGHSEPSPLSTVMMESPLALKAIDAPANRESQRTVQASIDDIMAAARKHSAESGPLEAPPTIDSSFAAEPTLVPDATRITDSAPTAPSEDSQPHRMPAHSTIHGIGPQEMASAPTMIRSSPQLVAEPPATSGNDTRAMPAIVTPDTGPTDLPGESTVIAATSSVQPSGGYRPRTFSNPELTPLPPAAPPIASTPDLGPLVQQVLTQSDPLASSPFMDEDTDRNPRVDSDAPLGSAPTMLFPAVQSDVPPPDSQDSIHAKKTMLPTELPLHQRKTGPTRAVPAEVAKVTTPVAKVTTPVSKPSATQKTVAPEPDAPASVVVSSSMPSSVSPTEEASPPAGPAAKNAPISAGTGEPTATAAPAEQGPYVPPAKGMFGSFSRAIDFFQQMFAYARRDKALLAPMYRNLTIATIVSVAISALLFVVHSAGAANGIMMLGLVALYFIDYQCNALTASLISDYVTTGRADMAAAKTRVAKVRSGILVFADVSGLLDFFTTYARERDDVVGRIMLGIVRAIWTTATYWVLPAMVIEGLSFGAAFSASKKKMEVDPTGVGAGVVALSLVSYFIGAIVFPLAFTLSRIGAHLHPAFGMVLFYAAVNVYWAVTGWLKISYSTCFYLWAKRCEETSSTDHANAPLPLRHALDAG